MATKKKDSKNDSKRGEKGREKKADPTPGKTYALAAVRRNAKNKSGIATPSGRVYKPGKAGGSGMGAKKK
jgi:hypothetical protein